MLSKKYRSYKQLLVWQKAKKLAVLIYEMTEKFPACEVYGLSAQMRRCAISVVSNIAEGSMRSSDKEFLQFLAIAYGSGAELETQVEIVESLKFGQNLDFTDVENLLLEVMKMLNKLQQAILNSNKS